VIDAPVTVDAPGSTLRVVTRPVAMASELEELRRGGRTVGLVPTMGALHAGHLSLIRRAAAECGAVAVSVFVNPLQFGPNEDLEAYPRQLQADTARAFEAGATHVFAPDPAEMYPDGFATTVHVGGITERLEGAARPGHFDGVTTVVTKLLVVAGACRAYFGEKDFQQLQVVRRLVRDLSLPVEVVGCPTVRDRDGLALSSRNVNLSPTERAAAPVLHRALQAGAALVRAGERDLGAVRDVMAGVIAAEPLVAVEYVEVVDAETLRAPLRVSGRLRLLVAARLGRTRLIDNLAAGDEGIGGEGPPPGAAPTTTRPD
jgi:pantoate--beta-alanine ligase